MVSSELLLQCRIIKKHSVSGNKSLFLKFKFGNVKFNIDLGAEKLIAAERESEKIAVEIKSFINPSPMNDFQNALGQYLLYRDFLEFSHKDYELYLAVRNATFNTFFQRKSIQPVIKRHQLNFIVFNDKKEEIQSWIKL
jgi:hypothetical protein